MGEMKDSVKERRAAMPIVSSFVDECRRKYGAEMMNKQMQTAIQARREYYQVLAQQGSAAAKRWHLANAHRCTFFAKEGGLTIGLPSPYGENS